MAFYLDPEVEILAKWLYEINPDQQMWDGDDMSFFQGMTRGEHRAKLAVEQAKFVLEMMGAKGRRKKI